MLEGINRLLSFWLKAEKMFTLCQYSLPEWSTAQKPAQALKVTVLLSLLPYLLPSALLPGAATRIQAPMLWSRLKWLLSLKTGRSFPFVAGLFPPWCSAAPWLCGLEGQRGWGWGGMAGELEEGAPRDGMERTGRAQGEEWGCWRNWCPCFF